jgi:hypothetical protein
MNRSLGQSTCLEVEITDINTGVKSTYHAIRAAARALNIDRRYIENYIYLKQEIPVFERYTFRFTTGGSQDKATSSFGLIEDKYNIRKQSSALRLEVLDVETNIKTIYCWLTKAAKELGIRQPSISLYLKDKRTKPFKGKYFFKLI